jgi:Flp pilus assembly protein TadD
MTTNPTNVHDSPEAWEEAGLAYIQSARYAEALAAFERVIQLTPAYARAYIGKGYALSELKRFEEAMAACDRALQLDPADARWPTPAGAMRSASWDAIRRPWLPTTAPWL